MPERWSGAFANAVDIAGERAATAHVQLAGQGDAHHGEDVAVLRARRGEERQVTGGQAEDGDLAVPPDARGAQEGPIAAERDHEGAV